MQHMWDGRDRSALAERVAGYTHAGFTDHIIGVQGPDHGRVAEAAAEMLPELRRTVVPAAT